MRKIALAIVLTLGCTSTYAIEGQWEGEYWHAADGSSFAEGYVDGSCFRSDGTWYSTTQVGLEGKWYQKGNELYINALNTDSNQVVKSVFSGNLEMVSVHLWTGSHQHWSVTDPDSKTLYLKQTLKFKKQECDEKAY